LFLEFALLVAAICGVALPSRVVAAGPLQRLALTDCRLEDAEHLRSTAAQCGELEVAEDRSAPTSPRIRLKVAVIPALNRSGPRDPLFVLSGGPGQAASDFYVSVGGAFARVQRQRDIVLLDQRGTGGSNALNCDFPEEDELAELNPAEIRRLAQNCLAALKSDPRHYTTSVAVRDLDDVRAALGYQRINLYGVSYGTRVAQHYMRRYPEHVRAVILDGVIAPGVVLAVDSAFHAQRALDLIFERLDELHEARKPRRQDSQVAALRGAEVWTTCSARNADWCHALGAFKTIDYTKQSFTAPGQIFDAVLDTIGGPVHRASSEVLKPGGRLVYLNADPVHPVARKDVTVIATDVRATQKRLLAVLTLIAQGRLKVPIEARFPLARAAEAYELSRSGHSRGKILLTMA